MECKAMKQGALIIAKNIFDCIHVSVSKSRYVLSDLIHNKCNMRLGERKILEDRPYYDRV